MKKTALLSLLVAIPFAQIIHVNADNHGENNGMQKGFAESIRNKLDVIIMKINKFDDVKIEKIRMHLEKKVEMETNMNKKSIYKYVLMGLNENENEGETAMTEEMEESKMAGEYIKYSEDLIGKNDKTVLFFHANWCPSCRAADKNIKAELENISEGLSILKTDYDKNKDLRKQYGVTSQHTFVQVDENGDLIKKWLGSNTVEEINNNVE